MRSTLRKKLLVSATLIAILGAAPAAFAAVGATGTTVAADATPTVSGAAGFTGGDGTAGSVGGYGIDVTSGAAAPAAGTILNVNSATITGGMNSAGTVRQSAVNAGANTTVNFSGVTNTLSGGLTSTGTVNIGGIQNSVITNGATSSANTTTIGTSQAAGTNTVGGNVTVNGALLLGISSTQANTGQIVQTGATSTTLTGASIRPYVTDTGMASGDKVVLVKNAASAGFSAATATGQTTAAGATYATDSSYNTLVRTWTSGVATAGTTFAGTDKFGVAISGTDVVLRTDIASVAALTGNRNSGQGSAFDTASNYNGATRNLVILNQAVQNLNTTEGVRRAADQLRPEASGATMQVAQNAVTGHLSTIENHNNAMRLASYGITGASAGDSSRGIGLWMEGFGSTAAQSEASGYTGYDATTFGATFGADKEIMKNGVLGFSLAYARGQVDEKGNRKGDTLDSNSYMASLYGTWSNSLLYTDVSATAGYHDYTQHRDITMPNYVQSASANYGAIQLGAKAEVGFPIKIAEKTYVSPLANLDYNHLAVDKYQETGAAGANLSVNAKDYDSVRGGIGASLASTFTTGSGIILTPTLRALYVHDFSSNSNDSTVSYVDGGRSFVVASADPVRDSAVLGASLDIGTGSNMTTTLAYTGEYKQDYISHGGQLRFRFDF